MTIFHHRFRFLYSNFSFTSKYQFFRLVRTILNQSHAIAKLDVSIHSLDIWYTCSFFMPSSYNSRSEVLEYTE